MSKKIFLALKVLLSVGIAALLLFLVFRNIEWDDFWRKAENVDYSWVILSISISIFTYIARAYRWNMLFKPLGYNLKTSRTMLAVLVGYLANLALPRLGEFARCGVLNRNDRVPVATALGTVVVDRLTDVAALFVLIVASLFIESERLIAFLSEAYRDLHIPNWLLVTLIILILAGAGFLVYIIKNQERLKGRIAELLKRFVQGFISLKDIENPLGYILSTVFIWGIYFLMSYVIVFSLPETAHLGPGAGLMLLITGGMALALPVQSGFGTYHGMISGMLVLYAIDGTTGVFIATLLHTSQILAIAFFGTIALIISFLVKRKKDDKRQDFK